MKKKNVLMATIAAASLALSCGAFAACGHTHTYSKEWGKDATGHWHYATCDDLKKGDEDYIKDLADHVWGDDDKCDICGYEKEETPSSVTLNKTELSLDIKNTEATLTATVAGGGEVTWSSSDPLTAGVTEDGVVIAAKPGKATITATAENGDTATCEVTVANAYYIIGGQDSAWNKVANFDNNTAIYLMPTETEGVYKTQKFELKATNKFQVALVGETGGDWWQKAFGQAFVTESEENDLVKAGDDIGVKKHGEYVVTLDMRGSVPVVSGKCEVDLSEGDEDTEYVYYVIGLTDSNPWTPSADEASIPEGRAFTKNEDGKTYSVTLNLTKGWEFKVLAAGLAWDVQFKNNSVENIGNNGTATTETAYKLTYANGNDNICVGLSGEYTLTVNPETGKLTYEFKATDATEATKTVVDIHCYIKGPAIINDTENPNRWDPNSAEERAATKLTKTEGEGYVYEATFYLVEGNFMFYTWAEYEDDGVVENQYDFFNNQNSTFTSGKYTTEGGEEADCVVADGANYKAVVAGYYTITVTRTAANTATITFSYSATAPSTPEVTG